VKELAMTYRNSAPTPRAIGKVRRKLFALTALAAAASLPPVIALAENKFTVSPLSEIKVTELPGDPLYWHVRSFPTIAEAEAAADAGALSLTAEFDGRAWLFTLRSGQDAQEGDAVGIGPVPRVEADEYLLRINSAVAPSGTMTSVHTHPGSEAIYVLSGQVSQRTPTGTNVLDAGETMPGAPEIPMELSSTGEEELRQLIMFVVDANKPFSTPASLD
jgi:quercetin dioxygenase-like cupin family protein